MDEASADSAETRRPLRRVRGRDGRALPRLHPLLIEDGVTESQL